jgi:hypothetical protein
VTIRRSFIAVLLFAVGLLGQVAVLGMRGTDVREFETWTRWIVEHGVTGAYRAPLSFQVVDGHPQGMDERPNYPPLSLAVLSISGHVYRWIDPNMNESRVFSATIKAPILLATAGLLPVVMWHRRRLPTSTLTWTPAAIVAAFWLNPALIVSGPVQGYLEALFWVPGAAALILAASGGTLWPGVLIAVSVLMKPQGLFFALPLATTLWSHPQHAAKALLVAAVTGVIVLLPFLATGNAGAMFHEVLANATAGDALLSQATNFWWMVTHAVAVAASDARTLSEAARLPARWVSIPRTNALTGLDVYRPAAAIVVLAALALGWRVRRNPSLAAHAAMAALVVHLYFTFGVGVHENHLDAVVPLLGLAALTTQTYRQLFWAMSALVLVNHTVFYGLGDDFNPSWMRDWVAIDAPLLLAFVNIGLLVWHARTFRRAIL